MPSSPAPRTQATAAGLGWDPGFVRSLLASTGGCIAAARAAWERGVSGSLSSGLHHARRDRGQGYCTVNGLAAAVRTFQDLGARRVLVIDLDAHGGGGTHDIAGGDDHVIQLDITTDRFDRYQPDPWSTLDHIDDAGAYLDTIRTRLDSLGHGSVDAVACNAGMDPHEDCAIGGLSGITADDLAERDRLVFDWAARSRTPIMFVLAGGYSSSELSPDRLTSLHRLTVDAAASVARRLERAVAS